MKLFTQHILVVILWFIVSGLYAQDVGFGYSGSLVLDNRISESLPVFGVSGSIALDASISEALAVFGISESVPLDMRVSEALAFFGFSDVFTTFTILTITLENLTITSPADTCMQAMESIIIKDLIVENNVNLVLVAGERVQMQAATHIEKGAWVRIFIDNTWNICYQPESLLAALEVDEYSESFYVPADILPAERETQHLFFRVYPNPTTGWFTLEIKSAGYHDRIFLEVMGLAGNRVLRESLPAQPLHTLSLEGHQPGLYFIRVSIAEKTAVERLIKTR